MRGLGIRTPRWRFTGYDRTVDCPEAGGPVECSKCAGCGRYGTHREGDAPRCRYEYEKLKEQGYYKPGQEGWMEYLSSADPETYERLKDEEASRRDFEEWWRSEQEELQAQREAMARELEELDEAEETPEPEEDDAEEMDPGGEDEDEE